MSKGHMMHRFPYVGRCLESATNGKSAVKDKNGNYIPNSDLFDLGLIYSHNFVLILNSHVYSVRSISNIDEYHPYDTIEEGGNLKSVFVRKYFGNSIRPINLSRAMPIRSSQLPTSLVRGALAATTGLFGGVTQDIARKAAMLAASELDPIATLEQGPAIGIIQIFDRNYERDVANFKFFSYGAEQWDIGGVDASSSEIVYESITLLTTDFQRMTTTWAKQTLLKGLAYNDNTSDFYDVGDVFDTSEENSGENNKKQENSEKKSASDKEENKQDNDNQKKTSKLETELNEMKKQIEDEKQKSKEQLDNYLAKIEEMRKQIEKAKSK